VYSSLGRDRLAADLIRVGVCRLLELLVRTPAGVYRLAGVHSQVARHRLVGVHNRAGVCTMAGGHRPVGGSLAVSSVRSFQPCGGWGHRCFQCSSDS
jgi:hypothetical protein